MNKGRVGIIVQARIGSTRLPGKVLKKLDENNRVLDILIKRLKLSKLAQALIIATSFEKRDSIIVDIAKSYNVQYFIGSENNVLERYYMAAKKFKIDIIVRITSDCPFVDPYILDDMIDFYKRNNYDYIFDATLPVGFDIEVFSFKTLKKVYKLAKTDKDKEHISSFINWHPKIFSIHFYSDERIKEIKDLRLTIDFPEDLELCREIYNRLSKRGKPINFSIFDIYEIIDENPEIMNINKHIPDKPILF